MGASGPTLAVGIRGGGSKKFAGACCSGALEESPGWERADTDGHCLFPVRAGGPGQTSPQRGVEDPECP